MFLHMLIQIVLFDKFFITYTASMPSIWMYTLPVLREARLGFENFRTDLTNAFFSKMFPRSVNLDYIQRFRCKIAIFTFIRPFVAVIRHMSIHRGLATILFTAYVTDKAFLSNMPSLDVFFQWCFRCMSHITYGTSEKINFRQDYTKRIINNL